MYLYIYVDPQSTFIFVQNPQPPKAEVEDPNNLGVILRTMEAFGSRTWRHQAAVG
jgi:hypothetical protein